MHVERRFTVHRPVEEVFTYFADFTTTQEWDPGTVTTTRLAGDGGLGTTWANTSEFLGRRVELVYETVTHRPPNEVELRGRNGRTTATDHLWFRADGGGTAVHYRATFDFSFPLKLVVPLVIRRRVEALADETVEQIRRSLG
ncbi:SRPBCC family protein [Nocardioides sp. AX2bis]|uniref:SRPBCC family protein n=1 Tax=Nocardioides sp. AX2bis TaxID=2653157 RepID=UPI0012F343C7|nr:SRPBCC family protein [Nocardioides sp. AX2bis]VXA95685.1 Polyketide cyclase [Nocardioides sp. AX2bis]